MPTYEYRCKSCGHELEVQQSFSDDPLETCPECGADQLRKVYGNVGISFKGSGFYKNDARSSSSKKAGSGSSSSTSSSSTSSESSSSGDSAKTSTPAASTTSTTSSSSD